jgi:hypothetical protein
MNSLPPTPLDGPRTEAFGWTPSMPDVKESQSFLELVRSVSVYVEDAIDVHHTFEQLRTTAVGHVLQPLVEFLSDKCHHPFILHALM